MALTTRRTSLTTRRRALTTLSVALAGTVALPGATALAGENEQRAPRPLWRAHAHNDYEHPRPLLDALDHRFGSVEADIYLVGDQLLVAHDPEDLDPARTLESLYLDTLAARVKANHGWVYGGHRTSFQLLIDIKTEGASTYLELDRHLKRYKSLFTTYSRGRVDPGAVTAVISGDRAARVPMAAQTERRAFYDGRLADLGSSAPASFVPLISDNWTLNFTWRGVGAFPAAERQKLRAIVDAAHARRQTVRFWATPDLAGPARDALWGELLAADVDFINTDDLLGLEAFLDAQA
ncbi:phosphatidylinositol-specific phospholipase C/glycerophosphodiester phosphodiesterase family protein [Streptomyces sp. NPDC056716]|uniref:phosphatidylinositol-specific phospholipase C/glycerophosphodiester phosphodiesterase family protein n=1 Tax=unclassified Streptomyces TaxID=2593676 RepID=UPI0036B2BC46